MRTGIAALWASPDARRFLKFLVVGFLNTIVGYVLYAGFVWVGVPPQPSLALSFALGVAWNFLTHGKLVFGTTGYGRLPHYLATYGFVYLCNAVALQVLLGRGISPLLAQGIILPFAAVGTFLLIGKALTGRWPIGGR